MRYVPSQPPPTLTGIGTREVRGAMRTRPVRPVRIRDHPEVVVDLGERHEPLPAAAPVSTVEHRTIHPEERRVLCRRVSHQPVLLDLRTGPDRRRHNLRGTDITEHIDEEA
ncbi:hypothetical protein FGKAn22_01870 [Ferrigenium kumadai]|uniref:Uncharacterized protein n=1 Tax=Ferrigenium kumadai TaxID=1682490 RepID=A0AAN1VYR6_9PROT|nr:hypothetical protein [Ferrigenium kumadai]BBI98494.1 hypothetical protein FGKAn22_01870 [Ferrigenium kumadai]